MPRGLFNAGFSPQAADIYNNSANMLNQGMISTANRVSGALQQVFNRIAQAKMLQAELDSRAAIADNENISRAAISGMNMASDLMRIKAQERESEKDRAIQSERNAIARFEAGMDGEQVDLNSIFGQGPLSNSGPSPSGPSSGGPSPSGPSPSGPSSGGSYGPIDDSLRSGESFRSPGIFQPAKQSYGPIFTGQVPAGVDATSSKDFDAETALKKIMAIKSPKQKAQAMEMFRGFQGIQEMKDAKAREQREEMRRLEEKMARDHANALAENARNDAIREKNDLGEANKKLAAGIDVEEVVKAHPNSLTPAQVLQLKEQNKNEKILADANKALAGGTPPEEVIKTYPNAFTPAQVNAMLSADEKSPRKILEQAGTRGLKSVQNPTGIDPINVLRAGEAIQPKDKDLHIGTIGAARSKAIADIESDKSVLFNPKNTDFSSKIAVAEKILSDANDAYKGKPKVQEEKVWKPVFDHLIKGVEKGDGDIDWDKLDSINSLKARHGQQVFIPQFSPNKGTNETFAFELDPQAVKSYRMGTLAEYERERIKWTNN